MSGHRRRALPLVLCALGAALMLWALAMLWRTPRLLQFVGRPPQEAGDGGQALIKLQSEGRRLGDEMTDSQRWMAVGGTCGVQTLTTAAGASQSCAVYALGEGWLDVYPRQFTWGRRIGEDELRSGACVIMLDEGLAFKLFGDSLSEDSFVELEGIPFRVVGTTRHAGGAFGGRSVGDAAPYDACIPLNAAAKKGIPLETVSLSSVPEGGISAQKLFEDVARDWLPGGEMISLEKEATRRTILPRMLLLILGLYALVGLFGRVTDLCAGWANDFRRRLSQSYLPPLIPRLIGLILLALACYGALVGLAWLLLTFSARPLYTFTEWVPENFTDWSSLSRVFWNLISEFATPVRYATRELREVEFWGALLRWGTFLTLLGAALRGKKGGKRE